MKAPLVSFVIGVLLLAAVPGARQAPAPQIPTFRSGVDVVQIDVSVLTRGENVLQPDQVAATGAADARYTLPLGSLRPGSYLLRVEATAERTTGKRDVRFEMR